MYKVFNLKKLKIPFCQCNTYKVVKKCVSLIASRTLRKGSTVRNCQNMCRKMFTITSPIEKS